MALTIYRKQILSKRRQLVQFASYIILFIGVSFLFWAFYPMISFELYARLFLKRVAASPLPESETVSSLEFAQSVYADGLSLSNNLRDFTQANVWFPASNLPVARKDLNTDSYTLSIPRLNLSNLNVKVGGNDLSESLIHYLPTSLPGQYGNVAIFGHSTLPQLFNPKDYKSVFTYLPKLEVGDKIYVQVNGGKYEYEVYDMFIVNPDEVSVLDQQFNDSILTLITCVPPGTYLQRLVVKARLVRDTSLSLK
ncbi:MAG: class D sortase [Candidatus Roizmanbacteria bacterium]|nr:class D sortase [Candidatus Roizmanbacteria bacterium]